MSIVQLIFCIFCFVYFILCIYLVIVQKTIALTVLSFIINVVALMTSVFSPLVVDSGSTLLMSSSCRHVIDVKEVENYGNNLNLEDYDKYNSEYQDFYFSYPKHLFNQAKCVKAPYITTLGENIESHSFLGSRGTIVSFSLFLKANDLYKENAYDSLLSQESSEIIKPKILLSPEKGFPGYAVTGKNNGGMIIYRIARLSSDYVMELRIVCPPYENEKDELEKRYVQECIVYMCGFSNPERRNVRSFSEFEKDFYNN